MRMDYVILNKDDKDLDQIIIIKLQYQNNDTTFTMNNFDFKYILDLNPV